MEAGGIPFRDWFNERLATQDARIVSNRDALNKVRDKVGTQGEALIEIKAKLEEQGKDIAEMKEDMKWIKRGLFGAIAVGLMFVISVSALVVQVAG